MLRTTIGQVMLNEALPQDLRNYTRKWDKKATQEIFQELAEKYPDKYREVSKRLMDISREAVYTMGGFSFGVDDLMPTPAVMHSRNKLRGVLEVLWIIRVGQRRNARPRLLK